MKLPLNVCCFHPKQASAFCEWHKWLHREGVKALARCAQLNALCREAQGPFSLLETHPGLVRSVNFAEAFCLGCSEPNCRHEGKEHYQDTKPWTVQASLSFQLQVQWQRIWHRRQPSQTLQKVTQAPSLVEGFQPQAGPSLSCLPQAKAFLNLWLESDTA